MRKKLIIILAVILVVIATGYAVRDRLTAWFLRPTPSDIDGGVTDSREVRVRAENLQVPWRTARLPAGDILVTERGGTLRRIGADGSSQRIEGAVEAGEGGLLGLTLHPGFSENRYLYLYLTTRTGDGLTNRVERYVYRDGTLSQRRAIIEDIPGAPVHDGGELQFGPDKNLYIGTGDAGTEALAQDTSSLAGKILRLKDDGGIPADNPFGNAVYSYGHRNVQGIAWDDRGGMWASEHGPSGRQSGFDELNRIERGGNYGWPLVRGDETRPGTIPPVVHSGASDTWAPASLAYAEGSLYFGGLRGQTLYQAILNEARDKIELRAHFSRTYGRLRGVEATGRSLLVTTSNTDGRGAPKPGDDKILEIPLSILRP